MESAIRRKARSEPRLKETEAVGCNFKEQVIGGEGVHSLELQLQRIGAIRDPVVADFFTNARTDLFLKTSERDEAPVESVMDRGKPFADAGASGSLVPRLRIITRPSGWCAKRSASST